MRVTSVFLLFFWLNLAAASSLVPLENSRVIVTIPYSLGSHKVEGDGFTGAVDFSEKDLTVKSGSLILKVSRLTGEKGELICHLQESLTLDYEKSDFPDEHVCEEDKLPLMGKNAPVHTEIKAELLKPVSIGSKTLSLKWTIHGVSREQVIPSDIIWEEKTQTLRIRTEFTIQLSDYDITVKKFLFIGVKDKVTLNLDLILGNK